MTDGRRRAALMVGAVVVVVGLVGVVRANRGDPGEGQSVDETAAAFFAAQADGDCPALLDLLSEASKAERGNQGEQCEDALDGYEPPDGSRTAHFEVVDQDGDRATVRSPELTGYGDEDVDGLLAREDGEWKVETDPRFLVVGRSLRDTATGYLEAFNEGDCDRLIDHLSEAAWSHHGTLTRDEFLEDCTAKAAARAESSEQPIDVTSVAGEVDDLGRATATMSYGDDRIGGPDGRDTAILVRDGLEWVLDHNVHRAESDAAAPFLTADFVDTRARLLDEVELPEVSCTATPTASGDAPAHDQGARPGVWRDMGCGSLRLYEFADRDEAEARARAIAGQYLISPPAPDAPGPGQRAAVPGFPHAFGVRTGCGDAGCAASVVVEAVDDDVVVVWLSNPDVAVAASVLRLQVDRM